MTNDDKCPNCGASIIANGYEDYNSYNEIVLKCANCGHDFGAVEL